MVSSVNGRRVAIALIALQCITATTSFAATTKPTPKVTATKKAPITKKSATPKKSIILKKALSPTKTPAAKKGTAAKKLAPLKKKVVVRKYIYRKRVRKAVQPSPSPVWPPKGFTSVGTAYARVPTGTELVGILSAMKNSSVAINSCAVDPKKPLTPAFSCAAILVGSSQKCTWWKVSSTITGSDPANPAARISIGDISILQSGAAAKTIQTIFLVSPVPLQTGIKFTSIHALCGIGPSNDPVPSKTFTPAPIGSPTPTATDNSMATPTPSPTTP